MIELQSLLDIQSAFVAAGKNFKIHFGNVIEVAEVDVSVGPQYFLAAKNINGTELMSQSSHHILYEYRCHLITFHSTAVDAVKSSIELIKLIHSAPSGNLGDGDRPKNINGVLFYKFDPMSDIKLNAQEFGKAWVVEQPVIAVAKKL